MFDYVAFLTILGRGGVLLADGAWSMNLADANKLVALASTRVSSRWTVGRWPGWPSYGGVLSPEP